MLRAAFYCHLQDAHTGSRLTQGTLGPRSSRAVEKLATLGWPPRHLPTMCLRHLRCNALFLDVTKVFCSAGRISFKVFPVTWRGRAKEVLDQNARDRLYRLLEYCVAWDSS